MREPCKGRLKCPDFGQSPLTGLWIHAGDCSTGSRPWLLAIAAKRLNGSEQAPHSHLRGVGLLAADLVFGAGEQTGDVGAVADDHQQGHRRGERQQRAIGAIGGHNTQFLCEFKQGRNGARLEGGTGPG